jgi:hypothetical protein
MEAQPIRVRQTKGGMMAKENGKQTVAIHGKEYELVSSRIHRFREDCKGWSIRTEIVKCENGEAIVRAFIVDDNDKIRATGIAREIEGSTVINKTSFLECCETSAIGRALACFDYQGGEYASADEIANALMGQAKANKSEPAHSPGGEHFSGNWRKNKVSEPQKALLNKLMDSHLINKDEQDEIGSCKNQGEASDVLSFWFGDKKKHIPGELLIREYCAEDLKYAAAQNGKEVKDMGRDFQKVKLAEARANIEGLDRDKLLVKIKELRETIKDME